MAVKLGRALHTGTINITGASWPTLQQLPVPACFLSQRGKADGRVDAIAQKDEAWLQTARLHLLAPEPSGQLSVNRQVSVAGVEVCQN
jgi:hypothetical protein